MPAYLPGTGALGTKLVTVFETNTARGLPTHLATILLLDPRRPAHCKRSSTAATSPRPGRLRSRPSRRDCSRVPTPAFWRSIGSGVQARSHLEALASRPHAARGPGLEPATRTRRRAFVDTASKTVSCRDPRRRQRARGGRGRRPRRPRVGGANTGGAGRVDRARRARLRRRRVPAGSAGDGYRPGPRRPPVRGFARSRRSQSRATS